jgi:murein DD-endopeptidase MepM/ murein hydrolase activator NlpD
MPPMLVPSVAPDPGRAPDLQGTPVVPMSNAAPQQISQLGEAMSRAGSAAFQTGQTMGDKIQDTVDDANVRAAETGFLQNAQGIVTGYTRQLGKNAMDAYDPATQALSKAKQDAAAGLTNPLQQKMFNYVSTGHLMNFGRQMADHNFQQTVNFGVKEGNDSADAQMQVAANNYPDWQNPNGKFGQAKQAAIAEVLQAGQLAGIPPGSAQSRAAIQQKTSALADNVLTMMIGQEHFDEAQQYYNTAIANGELDDQMQKKWNIAITEGHGADKSKDAGEQEVQGALGASKDQQRIEPIPGGGLTTAPTVGEPGRQEPVQGPITGVMGDPRAGHEHHGIDTAVPVGTPVKAPLDGLVSRVWNDQTGGGLSMEVTYPTGYKEYFMHLSAQNYKEGQKVTQGAILGLSGQSGNATGPVLHDAMKDPDGNWVDPRNPNPPGANESQAISQTPKDPLTFTEPAMLQAALTGVRGRTDLTERQKSMAEAYVERQYGIATNLKQGQYEEAKKAAVNLYYQQNGSIAGLDPAVKSQLTAEDIYKLNQPIPRKDDEDTVLDLLAHPEKVIPGTIEKYRMNLSQETYERFFKQAQDNATPGSPKILDATLDNNQLDTLLAKNSQAGLVDPKANTPEAQRKIDLKTSIDDQIDAEQTRLGRKLSRSEKESIMTQTIGDTVYLHHTFGSDKPVPLVTLNQDQLGNAYVNVGPQKVKLASIPAEDQKMIHDAWLETEKEHNWQHRELSAQEMATKWVQLQQARKPTAGPSAWHSMLPPF